MIEAINHLSLFVLLMAGALGFAIGVITTALIFINQPDNEEDEHERGI